MLFSVVVALLSGAAYAWLPEERDLGAFNSSRFDTRATRFQLPNGASKIRGVNFGGTFYGQNK